MKPFLAALVLCAAPLVACVDEPIDSTGEEEPAEDEVGELEATALPACPKFADKVKVGERQLAASGEASGLMVSRKNPGVLWTHDDSGDSSRVFAMTKSGKHLGIYNIANASFRDWEDMGLAKINGTWYLVMGDIGGNDPRTQVQVYLVPEPTVSATQSAVTTTIGGTIRLNLNYPSGEHNAEGLFVDPIDNSIYIVTKKSTGYTRLFRKRAPHVASTTTLGQAAAIDFSKAPLRINDDQGSRVATAAEISSDGDEILIKTYQSTFLWRRPAGSTVAQAMATAPCTMPNGGGETIALSPDSGTYYTTNEPAFSAIYEFRRE
jgi:hypothetical protein